MDKDDYKDLSMFLFILLVLFVALWIYAIDNIDKHTLGEYMCMKHNATLSSVDTNMYYGGYTANDKGAYLKIVCNKEKTKAVDDSYLYINK